MQASSSTGAARNARGQSLGRTASEKVASLRCLPRLLPGTPCTHRAPIEDQCSRLSWHAHSEVNSLKQASLICCQQTAPASVLGLQKLKDTCLQANKLMVGRHLRSRRDSDQCIPGWQAQKQCP